jgi:hypothetical protein
MCAHRKALGNAPQTPPGSFWKVKSQRASTGTAAAVGEFQRLRTNTVGIRESGTGAEGGGLREAYEVDRSASAASAAVALVHGFHWEKQLEIADHSPAAGAGDAEGEGGFLYSAALWPTHQLH